jgi:hypothetical protein
VDLRREMIEQITETVMHGLILDPVVVIQNQNRRLRGLSHLINHRDEKAFLEIGLCQLTLGRSREI